MDFRNKYLKYSPKITFDIFEKVWNKLIESGYLPVGSYSVKKAFGDFKTLHRYFRTTESHPMEFNCYSVIPRLDWFETTVQEILGYDPFVNDDDFVLPEKWCIKIPKFKDAPKEIIDWRADVKNYRPWVSAGYLDNSGWHSDNITDGYTEITFNQFKKFVLKQDVEKNIKINYYKCIKSDFPELVLGKLYPSHDGKLVKIPHGEYTSCFYVNDGGRFELSNKSAFDAQNQPKQHIKQYEFKSTDDKYMEVLRKNARTLCGEVAEISLTDYAELSKYMFDFGAKNADDNLRNSIAHGDVTLQNLSKSVTNYGLNDKNSVKISTDNEIKINIIQKQSIKI